MTDPLVHIVFWPWATAVGFLLWWCLRKGARP